MFPDYEEKYGYCVTITDPNSILKGYDPQVLFGTLEDMFERWPRGDFGSEMLGKKRGWDPVGTFVYDRLWDLHTNFVNRHPRPLLYRGDFYGNVVVTVTTARKKGNKPWRASSYHPDAVPWQDGEGDLKGPMEMVKTSWTELYEAMMRFLETDGGAQAYTTLFEIVQTFQEDNDTLREAKAAVAYRAELEAAEKAHQTATEKLRELQVRKP